jgi:hypothetical protein
VTNAVAPGLRAGLRYGAEAFALGFVLGTLRIIVLVPALGLLAAVLCEIPVMLLAMAWRAGGIVKQHRLRSTGQRAAMGAAGFALLMTCELGLGLALGTTPGEWFGRLATPAGAAGLAAQLVFSVLPLLVGRSSR